MTVLRNGERKIRGNSRRITQPAANRGVLSIGHPAQSPESRAIERGEVALEMNGVRLDVRVTRTGRIEKTFAKATTLRAERWLTLRVVVPEK